MTFAPVEDLITAVGRGDLVILVDDADRENEGDLMLAASHATAAKVGFMLRHTSGIICVSLLGERLDQRLGLRGIRVADEGQREMQLRVVLPARAVDPAARPQQLVPHRLRGPDRDEQPRQRAS